MARGRGLVAVSLIMSAMILGAFAVQYYTWTAPVTVKPLIATVSIAAVTEAGAVHNGTETLTFTPSTVALPTDTGENYKLRITLIPADQVNLAVIFDDLTLTVTVGVIVGGVIVDEISNSAALVTDGSLFTTTIVWEYNGPDGLGYAPGTSLDLSGSISENTKAVTEDTTGQIVMKIYAVE